MQVYLRGNYQKFFTQLDVFSCNRDKVFINVHGSYGLSGDPGSKSKKLGEEILAQGIANVVQLSTSRDWNLDNQEDKLLGQRAFQGKTFDMERQDIIDVIDLVSQNCSDLFGVKQVRIYLVGNSLGGTIVSTLDGRFDLIDKIVLCGSGIRTTASPTQPILGTFPSVEIIKAAAEKFHGQLLSLQGSDDTTVPLTYQQELFTAFENADKQTKIIPGANHNFSTIEGGDKQAAHKVYIETVINFLKN